MGKESGKGTRHSNVQKLLLTCILCLPFSIIVTQLSLPYAHAQQAQGESIMVQITGAAQPPGFLPALLTVHLYDTVVFVNQSAPAATYAISAQDGSFASPAIAHGEQWAVTVNATGPHPYSVSSVSTMVGEIFVVANTVSLLPTPLPQAQATVDAALTAGKSPPDVTGLSTTIVQNGGGQSPFTPLLILIVILNSVLTISLLIALTLWFLMRRLAAKKALMASLEAVGRSQQHDGELADSSQQETIKSKRRFFWQRRKGDDDDGDVELDMDDDEE